MLSGFRFGNWYAEFQQRFSRGSADVQMCNVQRCSGAEGRGQRFRVKQRLIRGSGSSRGVTEVQRCRGARDAEVQR